VDESARFQGEADTRRMIQELELTRIELEMQNEELQRAQEELKDSWHQIDQRVVARTALLTQTIQSLSLELQVRSQAEQSLRAENVLLRQELERSDGKRDG
jgi:cell shape-determining protein MreC